MTTIAPAPTRKKARPQWLIPAGLILLSLVPVIAGASRLGILSTGEVNDDTERYLGALIPVITHIVSATVFCVLGAFQFVPRLRRGRPSFHRISGRIVWPAGVLAGFSGLWMAVFFAVPADDGGLLIGLRLVVGTAMITFLSLGLRAVLRRDIQTHSAWMMRGYALGIGAGTQVLVLLGFAIPFGEPNDFTNSVLMGSAWAINLLFVERIIRRRAVPRAAIR